MHHRVYIILFLTGIIVALSCQSKQEVFPTLRGPYLGQSPPDTVAQLFAPDIVSTGAQEMNLCVSPDGQNIYYHVTGPIYRPRFMMHTSIKDGKWTDPMELPFTQNKRSDAYPFISPDGKLLFYNTAPPGRHHREIYFVQVLEEGWSEPIRIEFPDGIRSEGAYPSVASNGNLYFNATLGSGNSDIYMSNYQSGTYTKPVKLPPQINTEESEFHPYIAPDESFLIFDAARTKDNLGSNDLYISFREENGEWTLAKNMGESVNTHYSDLRPFVTYDGKYLFFVSNRMNPDVLSETAYRSYDVDALLNGPTNGNQDIYWISAEIIEGLRSL